MLQNDKEGENVCNIIAINMFKVTCSEKVKAKCKEKSNTCLEKVKVGDEHVLTRLFELNRSSQHPEVTCLIQTSK